MYKTESMLGLIGSIISAVFTFLFLAGTLIVMFFFSFFQPMIQTILSRYAGFHIAGYGWTYENLTAFVIPVIGICAAVTIIIAAASFILGFIGSAKLRRDDRNGGVMLIIAGALSLISIVGFIPFILQIVGGIMAVSRKPAAFAQPELNKSV